MRRLVLSAVMVLGTAFSGVASAQDTYQVTLQGTTFTPADIRVALGDTVNFVWVSGVHNVVSGVGGVPDGAFSSGGITGPPASFSVTFDETFVSANPVANNEYNYYCDPHLGLGMIGVVRVSGVSVPALPFWSLVTMFGTVAGAAWFLMNRRRRGLRRA